MNRIPILDNSTYLQTCVTYNGRVKQQIGKEKANIHHILGVPIHQSFPRLRCMVVGCKVLVMDLAIDSVKRAQKMSAKISIIFFETKNLK